MAKKKQDKLYPFHAVIIRESTDEATCAIVSANVAVKDCSKHQFREMLTKAFTEWVEKGDVGDAFYRSNGDNIGDMSMALGYDTFVECLRKEGITDLTINCYSDCDTSTNWEYDDSLIED